MAEKHYPNLIPISATSLTQMGYAIPSLTAPDVIVPIGIFHPTSDDAKKVFDTPISEWLRPWNYHYVDGLFGRGEVGWAGWDPAESKG